MAARGPGRPALGVTILDAARRVAIARGADLTAQDVIKEAGVSLQTFYRYFASRDRLVLEMLAAWIRQRADEMQRASAAIADPVARLELHVRSTLQPARSPAFTTTAQFVTAEHWRLHQRFPEEMTAVVAPFVETLRREIDEASDAGLLSSDDPARDARVMTRTILGSFHHLAFLPDGPEAATAADDVWRFCLAALGGRRAAEKDG